MKVAITINGTKYERDVEPRKLLAISCAKTAVLPGRTSDATLRAAAAASSRWMATRR